MTAHSISRQFKTKTMSRQKTGGSGGVCESRRCGRVALDAYWQCVNEAFVLAERISINGQNNAAGNVTTVEKMSHQTPALKTATSLTNNTLNQAA